MTKEELKEKIAHLVEYLQGCKALRLATHKSFQGCFSNFCPGPILDEMVEEGMLVEVQYELPGMSYRTKSFYLPGGTKARVS